MFGLEDDEAERAAAVAQHREVLEALLAEDWARAKSLLSRHVWHQLASLEKAVRAAAKSGIEIEGQMEPQPERQAGL